MSFMQRREAMQVAGWLEPAWTVLHPSSRIWDRGKNYSLFSQNFVEDQINPKTCRFPYWRVLVTELWIFSGREFCHLVHLVHLVHLRTVPPPPQPGENFVNPLSNFHCSSFFLWWKSFQMTLQGIGPWQGDDIRARHIMQTPAFCWRHGLIWLFVGLKL